MRKFCSFIAGLLLLAAPLSASAFAFTPPTGFSAWTGTFNPSDKGGNVTLSGGNLIATEGAGEGWNGVRGTVSQTSGKWYYEVTDTLFTTDNQDAGFSTSGTSLTGGLPWDRFSTGWGYRSDGNAVTNDTNTQTGGTPWKTNGDVVMLAYDASAGKMWVGVNGTWQFSGDPASGANPLWTVSGGTALFPTWAAGQSGNVGTGAFSAPAAAAQIFAPLFILFGDW